MTRLPCTALRNDSDWRLLQLGCITRSGRWVLSGVRFLRWLTLARFLSCAITFSHEPWYTYGSLIICSGVDRSPESVRSCGGCQVQACYSMKVHPLHKTLTSQPRPVQLQWGPADRQSRMSWISRTSHCSLTERFHWHFASQMNDEGRLRFGSFRFAIVIFVPIVILLSILIFGFGIIILVYCNSRWNLWPHPRGRLPNKMLHFSFFVPSDLDLWPLTLTFKLE